MLSTTLKVVPGESTFESNVFSLMCGACRFSTFWPRRTLVPGVRRDGVRRAEGKNVPFRAVRHEEKCPLVLKAHNSPRKPTHISTRSAFALSAFLRSVRLDNNVADDDDGESAWWKHERGLFAAAFSTHTKRAEIFERAIE